MVTYIGTQANKLHLAVDAMDDLMKDLPRISAQFENAKNSAWKQIAKPESPELIFSSII